MPLVAFRKPKLPNRYYILFEPPDDKGEEVMHFISDLRRVKLKGRSFREFQRSVVPLLDGRHSVSEIVQSAAEDFAAEELEQAFALLAEHNLLQEGDGAGGVTEDTPRLQPQLNLFHDLGVNPRLVQERLRKATIAIVGAGAIGATAAQVLASAGVGSLRLLDRLPVLPTDLYLAPGLQDNDLGHARAAALARHIARNIPEVDCIADERVLETESEIANALDKSDVVLCCTDPGHSSSLYKVNRVCLSAGIRSIAAAASALEVTVGPMVQPYESACHLCHKMRLVAGSENPEDEFAFQSFLDRRKQDDSAVRQNLVFGTMLAGNLLGLEAMKVVSGVMAPSTIGRVFVFDLRTLSSVAHRVLRKPWCPACHRATPDSVEPVTSAPGSR